MYRRLAATQRFPSMISAPCFMSRILHVAIVEAGLVLV